MIRFNYKIIRSPRRTLSLQISNDGEVIVRAPYLASGRQIEKFVSSHAIWVDKKLKDVEQKNASAEQQGMLTADDLKVLAKKAKKFLPERVVYYANIIGVSYGRISIRAQSTRWGSCSDKGNLNFNCLLMLTPPEVIDSVIVHELCHRRQMNHSPAFYREVLKAYPDYKKWNKWLKENGPVLMARVEK